VADGHTAKITVNLTQDAVYTVDQGPEGLTIAFSRDLLLEEETLPSDTADTAVDSAAPAADTIDPEVLEAAAKGTCIEMVDFKEQSDGIEIAILADGTITDYSAFTVDNPPRIVFDIYDINSPFKGLQRIEVESKWVKGVRHFCYPDKLRVVLDTDRRYLTTFTSQPVKNGLLINVAEAKPILDDALVQTAAADTAVTPAPAVVETVVIEDVETPPVTEETAIPLVAANSNTAETAPETMDTAEAPAAAPSSEAESQTAWLNKLEFTSVEEGASLISIGTTHAVRYDMERLSDRKLQLKLFNTRVPQYRKRPLITTRFNSAVDRITPIETDPSGDHSLVVFELREGRAV
jgi:type IV pilus assembly protein PilQ